MNDVLLPLSIRNSKVVHIDDVANGLACGCSCPVCGGALVAKNRGQKQHHFAHHSSEECSDALETALHLLAKQILVESKCIFLPELKARASSKDRVGKKYVEEELIVSPGLYQLDNPLHEKKIGDVVADVFATHKGHELLIEVSVTHFVDKKKKSKASTKPALKSTYRS
ncbi:MAG: competence protein CoiA family protein [Candidatus Thiodiazotropha endolucinida]|uniref:Competence protein CoiA-like family protein n=1 Tax=Candidatus Thiodiazotropha endolucinida TaxID=1655433 RepID=A0A7Z0VIS5_9GAMM|nr:competence protein CoiA family protein [Candidatus Thiodiazotropha endolucinida]ODJ86318.1 competence protein CoiA-like family protein [Candidatus Thiodiazotropha endolucinida]